MLSEKRFTEFVRAASLASSGDNMQPWEFRKQEDTVEVFCAKPRVLPTDVTDMFAWVSVGAAIQNLVVAAAAHGLVASVEYSTLEQVDKLAAVVRFLSGSMDDHLADWIVLRTTNRSPYQTLPLRPALISKLTQSVQGLNAGIHWTTVPSNLDRMASMDANLSYIRLEHKPLFNELFDILRFTQKEIESYRYGLDFKSLEVPAAAALIARQLPQRSIYRTISRLGMGRLIAKKLSSRLCKAGALCLVTAQQRNPAGYMEAGRAMEQLWLAAAAEGLSIHPYGVLPQYLTKVELAPETFTPEYASIIESHREPFYSIFPGAKNEYPAIVLRVGRADNPSPRSNIRLRPDQIIRI